MTRQTSTSSRKQRKMILGVVALALMMVVSAVSGLNVALPSLARDTGASSSELQWIVDGYTMVFAGLLLIAGAIGDRFGRKEILLAGLAIFGASAAAALFVTDPVALIAVRAAMGLGAAFVMPTTLSIITTSFPAEERAQAVGVWVGMAGGGAIIGLLGSGVLLEFFDWSAFFALNVTLAVLAFIGTLRVIPRSRAAGAPRLDVVGGALSLIGVTSLVFGIIEGPERGWDNGLVVGALVGSLTALTAFVLWELRREDPMLDPRLFALRGFGSGSLSITVQFLSAYGFFFIILQYLQYVAGLSPLQAALVLMPLPVVMMPLARQAPKLAARFGLNRVGALGLVLLAGGLAVLSLLGTDLNYLVLWAGVVVFAAGMALAGTPATTAIVSSLPEEKQGVASAVNDVSREFGSAIGIALLGSVLSTQYRSGIEDSVASLPPDVANHAEESISFVQQAPVDSSIVSAAEHAFVNATGTALLVASGLLLVAAAFVGLRAPRRDAVQETDGHAFGPIAEPVTA